ncbi:tetratricopeptide repeat protein [Streptomyces sp. NPDC058412]|uniref:tetratricopeptide repeat protein n=1 Tax=Streptomyces sp. NPDC058412 TaxID=3346486 RepID=UPI003662DE08
MDEPKAVAYYQTTLADAAALDSDQRLARTVLARSQHAIEKATAAPGESWANHFSTGRWAHHAGMILARLGDLDDAHEHLQHALDVHGLDRRRSRAIVLGDLGDVHLRQGDLDGALTVWSEFIDCADGVQSVKITDALTDMRGPPLPVRQGSRRRRAARGRGVARPRRFRVRAVSASAVPALTGHGHHQASTDGWRPFVMLQSFGVAFRASAFMQGSQLRTVRSFAGGAAGATSGRVPRIGCGLAGGTWSRIEPPVTGASCARDVEVAVYDRG